MENAELKGQSDRSEKYDILFVSSELSPYAKTGGLGDVAAALPGALRRAGHRVAVVIPGYRCLWEEGQLPDLAFTGLKLDIPLGNERYRADIYTARTREGAVLWIIGNPEFFDRDGLYGDPWDYGDNAKRFIFFSKAATRLAAYVDPQPQILHLNDWQSAMAAVFTRAEGLPYRTVLTIHNLAYQGNFAAREFQWTNLPEAYFSSAGCEFYGQLNFLKAGILMADRVSTVSPGYAREILTPEFGCGLHEVLGARSGQLKGIVNGIDADSWNPKHDSHLPVSYAPGEFDRKEFCKRELLRERALSPDASRPLFGAISRLADQKGFDLLLNVLPEVLHHGGRAVVLGSGDPWLEEQLTGLSRKFPDQLSVEIGFDESLAHRIEAGSDFFLMPSRFEPCGLNQMYSQRYGTVPIVHGVGGLKDTVDPWQIQSAGFFRGKGNGFVFDQFDADSFYRTIVRAAALRKMPPYWDQIRLNGMHRDFSWNQALKQYEQLYQEVLTDRSLCPN
jgi:starch synthase